MKILKDWKRRAEWFTFKDDDLMPVSFAVELYRVDTRPLYYYASFDTNRWRSLVFAASVGQWKLHVQIPYRRLPDHVPSERQLRMRERSRRPSEARK